MRLRLGLMFVQLDRLHLFKMNETCCFRPKRFPRHGGVFLIFFFRALFGSLLCSCCDSRSRDS